MNNAENKIRLGVNTLGTCGILKSYKLNYKKARDISGDNLDFNEKDKGDKITGSFTLLVGEIETITINLSYGVSEFGSYKDKQTEEVKAYENKNFKILTEMEAGNLPTIADVEDKTEATYIQLTGKRNYKGKLSENIYLNSTTNVVATNLQYELGNGTLYIKDKDKVKELYAQFTADVFVGSVTPETVFNSKTEEEDETGRIEIKAYIPTSKGSVIPLTLIAEEDMAEAIKDNVDEEGGETLYVEGTIHCSATQVEEEESTGKGWGKKRKEAKTVYKNELIIDYAEPVEDGEDEEGNTIEKTFKSEDIKAYMVERENIIEATKNGESNSDEVKSERKGFGGKSKEDKEETSTATKTKRNNRW